MEICLCPLTDLTPRPSVIKWSASCVLFPHRISFLLVTQTHIYFRKCGIHCDSTSESDQRLFMAAVDPDGPNIDARHAQSLTINITYTGGFRAVCIVWLFVHSFILRHHTFSALGVWIFAPVLCATSVDFDSVGDRCPYLILPHAREGL